MKMKTHYDVLGVPRNASIETIRIAFRKAAKKYHPDLNGGDTRKEAQLRRVLAAYEMLKKPGHRAAYDCFLRHRRRERFRTLTMTVGAGVGSGSIMVALMLALVSPQVASGSGPAPRVVVADAAPVAVPLATPPQTVVEAKRPSTTVARKSDRAETVAIRRPREDAPAHVRQAAKETPPAADRSKSRTRMAKDEKRLPAGGVAKSPDAKSPDAKSPDAKSLLGFAARTRDPSEAEHARSKLLAMIDSADDMALLSVLGLGDGTIAERAQQRLDRLRAPAAAKESKAPSRHDSAPSLKERAARFVTARVAAWASMNEDSLATFASAYADKVHYYGSRKSRHAIMLDKRHFLERWPERTYSVRPDSLTVECVAIVCKVAGMVDWEVRNPARAKSARGVARFEYELAASNGGFRILSESDADVKRPRQSAACAKPSTGATSATTRESLRQAARCAQIARATYSAKLKRALQAQAKAWQQRPESPERAEFKFADRWPQEAALQRTQ
jgi:hypothetical protein